MTTGNRATTTERFHRIQPTGNRRLSQTAKRPIHTVLAKLYKRVPCIAESAPPWRSLRLQLVAILTMFVQAVNRIRFCTSKRPHRVATIVPRSLALGAQRRLSRMQEIGPRTCLSPQTGLPTKMGTKVLSRAVPRSLRSSLDITSKSDPTTEKTDR